MQQPLLFLAIIGLLFLQAIMPFAIDFIASIALVVVGFMLGRTFGQPKA